jgi:hypothetical protein
MISVIINADTRQGYLADKSTVGDFGPGSLEGVRSVDFLLDGIENKMRFFDGYDKRCVLYIDQHEIMSDELFAKVSNLVNSYGNDSILVVKPHDRVKYKWNDRIYIEAFKYTKPGYTVHVDTDCSLYKRDDCNIVEQYFKWLDEGYKYVCQPWDRLGDDMYWASTRFFICKTETLDQPLIEKSVFINPLMGKHNPCYEHTIGILAGEGNVLYPPRDDDNYMIFCWARYFSGLIKHLNNKPYNEVKDYILDCGLFGTHDVIAKPITNE